MLGFELHGNQRISVINLATRVFNQPRATTQVAVKNSVNNRVWSVGYPCSLVLIAIRVPNLLGINCNGQFVCLVSEPGDRQKDFVPVEEN